MPRSAGTHPFFGSFFVRWYLWTGPFCVATLAFTPFFGSSLITWFYRALGTRIGGGCCIGGGYSAEPDSFSIGDGCVLESFAAASNHTSECLLLRWLGLDSGRMGGVACVCIVLPALLHIGPPTDHSVVHPFSFCAPCLALLAAVERRNLTISSITLGSRVTLGVYGVVFPDAELEDGASLEACSIVLKGERLMAGTRWRGIPAEPVW